MAKEFEEMPRKKKREKGQTLDAGEEDDQFIEIEEGNIRIRAKLWRLNFNSQRN